MAAEPEVLRIRYCFREKRNSKADMGHQSKPHIHDLEQHWTTTTFTVKPNYFRFATIIVSLVRKQILLFLVRVCHIENVRMWLITLFYTHLHWKTSKLLTFVDIIRTSFIAIQVASNKMYVVSGVHGINYAHSLTVPVSSVIAIVRLWRSVRGNIALCVVWVWLVAFPSLFLPVVIPDDFVPVFYYYCISARTCIYSHPCLFYKNI